MPREQDGSPHTGSRAGLVVSSSTTVAALIGMVSRHGGELVVRTSTGRLIGVTIGEDDGGRDDSEGP